MRTIKIITAVFALCLLSSGVFAQSCYLTVNDANNTTGENYDLVVQLWNCAATPYMMGSQSLSDIWFNYNGYSQVIALTIPIVPDLNRLEFRIYAQNQTTLKWGYGVSQNYFTSTDYYYNSPPVTVTVP